MELYKLRYNLYNYLIKDNFDYNSNNDYLVIWKRGLIIIFIFLILIIVFNYNKIELYSLFIIALIIIFLYIIYFDMNNYINDYNKNKFLISYKNYYEILNAFFIENYNFIKDDDFNNTILINIKEPKDILKSEITQKLTKANKDNYDAYITNDYLYLKLNNYNNDNYDYKTKVNNYKFSSVTKDNKNVYLTIDNLISNIDNNVNIPDQTPENDNIYYIKLKTTELKDRNKLINFNFINELINNLIDKLNSKKTNNFIIQINNINKEIIPFLQTYMDIIQRIKRNIKYNENKTNEEINEKIYNNLVINNDVLKYIDIYDDPDISYLKDFLFIKYDSFIDDKNYNNFFKLYKDNKNKTILLNNNTEESVNTLIIEINNSNEIYYFININKLNNILHSDKYPFMKELIIYINNKYKLNYENIDILYKKQNINLNTEILKIVNNFNYLYIKVIIIILILIAIIFDAFYREFIRYIR